MNTPGSELLPSGARAGSAAWLDLIPSWPLLLALAAFARAMAQPRALLNDPDTYLHIAAGRWMLSHSALPVEDPFSHSLAGATWVPHEWLAEVVLAAVYQATGWSGLVLLGAACFGATMAILTRFLLRHFDPFSTLIVATLGSALALGHLLVRPHILALPLLVVWCGELLAARDAGRGPPFRLLPLMALWANLHGSFMFGLVFALFLGAEAVLQPGPWPRLLEARRWAVFGVLTIAAALLTPNGLAGFIEPLRLMMMPALQASFTEWLSPDFHTFQPLEIYLLGLIALGFTTGAMLPFSRLLLLLALCHMALVHMRHTELLGLVGPLIIAAPFGPQIAARLRALPLSALGQGVIRLATPASCPAMLLALAVAVAMSLVLMIRPVMRTEDPVTPAAALDAAASMGLRGPVFNSESFGGYLVFRGIPTFIDGRIELYGNDFLARYLEADAGDEMALANLIGRYGTTWTLLKPRDGAVRSLDSLPGWRRVYSDSTAVIHIRG
ncbi:MAG: hypothetical protein JO212_13260 [Acetobacteraceae bacterium]|nr:hypothetical protein [Acetobacteraceae bacterium]